MDIPWIKGRWNGSQPCIFVNNAIGIFSSKNLNIHHSKSHRASSQQHQQNQQLHHQNGEESQSQPASAIHRRRRPVVVSNDMMVPVVDDGDSANETIGDAVAEQTANIDTATINNP